MLSTGQLVADHVTAVERLHGPVTVDRRCADLAELIAAAHTTRADAALIIGSTQKVTSAVLSGLAEQGLIVVAISDAAAERSRLTSLGAVTFNDDVDAERLAEALAAGQPPATDPGQAVQAPNQEADDFVQLMETAGLAPAEPEGPSPNVVPPDQLHSDQLPLGQLPLPEAQLPGVTVIWGAAGSPGRTTLAVNLAAELALTGARTLVIDADTYGASVAVHLGLMEESAGLAQACRAADLARLDPAALAAAISTVVLDQHELAVLTGLPRPERWTELRAHSFELVLAQARADFDHILIDTAPWIEQDEELALDSRGTAPQRNTAARCALSQADTVMAVGGADPVGFSRLIKMVQELQETIPQAPTPQVIVSQLRKDVIGRSPRRQLADAWQQLGPGGSIHSFLAWDQPGCDAALRAGEVLAEAAEGSVLRRQIAALAGVELPARRRLLPGAARSSRRGRRRVETAVSKR